METFLVIFYDSYLLYLFFYESVLRRIPSTRMILAPKASKLELFNNSSVCHAHAFANGKEAVALVIALHAVQHRC